MPYTENSVVTLPVLRELEAFLDQTRSTSRIYEVEGMSKVGW